MKQPNWFGYYPWDIISYGVIPRQLSVLGFLDQELEWLGKAVGFNKLFGCFWELTINLLPCAYYKLEPV